MLMSQSELAEKSGQQAEHSPREQERTLPLTSTPEASLHVHSLTASSDDEIITELFRGGGGD